MSEFQKYFTHYVHCPKCGRIIFDVDLKLDSVKEPCPSCDEPGFRRLWPSIIAHEWLECIHSYAVDRPESRNVLAVMLCSMAEVLMEDLLKNILFNQKAPSEHMEIMLDSHEGHHKQCELFRKLCGQSMKDSLVSLGMVEFFDTWQRIVVSRNKFVHGTPPGDMFKHYPNLDDLMTVRDNILQVFCLLHNKCAC